MKGKYMVAAGTAVLGAAVYYFWQKRKTTPDTQPQKEWERHHLTNAFAKAKKVAIGK